MFGNADEGRPRILLHGMFVECWTFREITPGFKVPEIFHPWSSADA
jgi:hypothetical protein